MIAIRWTDQRVRCVRNKYCQWQGWMHYGNLFRPSNPLHLLCANYMVGLILMHYVKTCRWREELKLTYKCSLLPLGSTWFVTNPFGNFRETKEVVHYWVRLLQNTISKRTQLNICASKAEFTFFQFNFWFSTCWTRNLSKTCQLVFPEKFQGSGRLHTKRCYTWKSVQIFDFSTALVFWHCSSVPRCF